MHSGATTILTAKLYSGSVEVEADRIDSYEWSGPGIITNNNTREITVDSIKFKDGFVQYICKIALKEEKSDG